MKTCKSSSASTSLPPGLQATSLQDSGLQASMMQQIQPLSHQVIQFGARRQRRQPVIFHSKAKKNQGTQLLYCESEHTHMEQLILSTASSEHMPEHTHIFPDLAVSAASRPPPRQDLHMIVIVFVCLFVCVFDWFCYFA